MLIKFIDKVHFDTKKIRLTKYNCTYTINVDATIYTSHHSRWNHSQSYNLLQRLTMTQPL